MATPKRYYAECTTTETIFESRWERSWQVFDRERCTPQGACMAIALCADRATAFKIRDVLNGAGNA